MNFFLNPDRLWHLLWIVPALLVIFFVSEAMRRNAVKKLLGPAHYAGTGSPIGLNASPAKRALRFFLILISAILLVATYARPTWGSRVVPYKGAGRDIVVALDLSKSMLSQDIRPSRLEHAKRFIDDLNAKMKGDRFGLVVFSGDAFLTCPLTFDRVSFRNILADQQIGGVPLGGTNLEKALKVSATAFDTAENLGHYAIVLVTDGGELTGVLAREAEKLRAAKMPVVVVGVGDPVAASPIPIKDSRGNTLYLKDQDGNTVNTRLEEKDLRELAAKTGGVYIHSTITNMNDSAAADWLKSLTPGAQDENSKQLPIERWPWFLIPATVAFGLFLLCGECVRERKGIRLSAFKVLLKSTHVILFCFAVLLCGNTVSAEELKIEEPPAGTQEATKLPETDVAEDFYNEGLKAQEAGDDARAREIYEAVLSKPNLPESVRNSATQNLGASFHTEARKGAGTAAQTAQMNLDQSLKEIEGAEKKFAKAADFYQEVLRTSQKETIAGTAKNQQILLNDMKRLQELKKTVEELKKQMQQAQQDAENAEQKQQEANQEQNQQQKQKKQEEAERSREKAQQSAEKMQQQAEKLKNESSKNSAKQAAQEMQNAKEEQERGNGEKAEEHLKKAKKILEQEAKNQNGEDKSDDKEKGKNSEQDKNQEGTDQKQGDEQQESQDLSKEPEEKEAQTAAQEGKEERNLDKEAAESIMRDMAKEEGERRKAIIKSHNGQIKDVEKDW